MVRVEAAARRTAAVALTVAPGAAAIALGRVAVHEGARLWASRAGLGFDDLVLLCALGLLTAVAGWLSAAVLLTATTCGLRRTHGAAARLVRVAHRVSPAGVRRLVGGVCGAAVLAGPVAGAAALAAPVHVVTPVGARAHACAPVVTPVVTPVAGHVGGHRRQRRADHPEALCAAGACPRALRGLPLPDRPTLTRPRVDAADTGDAIDSPHRPVVVLPGDTLWVIAARHLPPGATDAEIAAAWPAWFGTNRARIGSDPHLIHPGTRLVVPQRFRRADKEPRR